MELWKLGIGMALLSVGYIGFMYDIFSSGNSVIISTWIIGIMAYLLGFLLLIWESNKSQPIQR